MHRRGEMILLFRGVWMGGVIRLARAASREKCDCISQLQNCHPKWDCREFLFIARKMPVINLCHAKNSNCKQRFFEYLVPTWTHKVLKCNRSTALTNDAFPICFFAIYKIFVSLLCAIFLIMLGCYCQGVGCSRAPSLFRRLSSRGVSFYFSDSPVSLQGIP